MSSESIERTFGWILGISVTSIVVFAAILFASFVIEEVTGYKVKSYFVSKENQ